MTMNELNITYKRKGDLYS